MLGVFMRPKRQNVNRVALGGGLVAILVAVLITGSPALLQAQKNESYFFATGAINDGAASFVDKYCGPDMLPYTADDITLPENGNSGGTWGFSWIDVNGDGKLQDDEHVFTLIRRDDDDIYSFVPQGFPQYGALKEGEYFNDFHEARNNGPAHDGASCLPEELPGCLGDDFEHNDRGGKVATVGQPGFEGAQNFLWYNNDRANQRGWGGSKYYFELKNGAGLDEMEGFVHWCTFQNNSDDPATTEFDESGACKRDWMRSPELVVKGLLIPVDEIAGLKHGDLDALFGWYSGDMADYVRDVLGPKMSDPALNTTANDEDCATSETNVVPTHLAILQLECPIKINADASCADQAQAEAMAAYWGIEPIVPGQPETAAVYRASNILLFNDALTQVGDGTPNFITQPPDEPKMNLWVQDSLWRNDKTRLGRYLMGPEPSVLHPAPWTVQDDTSTDAGCGNLDGFFQLDPGIAGFFQAPLDATLTLGSAAGAIHAVAEFATRDLPPPLPPGAGAGPPPLAPVFQIILMNGSNIVAYAEVSDAASSVNLGGTFNADGLASGPTETKAAGGGNIPSVDPLTQFPTTFSRFVLRASGSNLKLSEADFGEYAPADYSDLDGYKTLVSLDKGISGSVTAVRFATSGALGLTAIAYDGVAVFQNLDGDAPPEGVGPFLRGDCNSDGKVTGQVADAIFLLNFNFLGGTAPSCNAACDVNGDGLFSGQVTDAVFLLNFNFLGGPAPPAPFPACGLSADAADVTLGCADTKGCQQ